MTEGDFAKKKELFLEQKKTLDTFLKTGAISQLQYALRIVGVHSLPYQSLGSGQFYRVEDIVRCILTLPAATGKKKHGCYHQTDYDIDAFGHYHRLFTLQK